MAVSPILSAKPVTNVPSPRMNMAMKRTTVGSPKKLKATFEEITLVMHRAMGTSMAVIGMGITSVKKRMAETPRMPSVIYALVGSSGSLTVILLSAQKEVSAPATSSTAAATAMTRKR